MTLATFFLINSVTVGGIKLSPGDLVNDANTDTTKITAAGGLLWPSSDPLVAASAAVAQNARKNRGASELELESIMQTAVQSAQKSDQSGTATLVAGVATVATGIYITSSSKVFLTLNTPGGTQGTLYKTATADLVVGGPGVGTLVIKAVDTSGALVNTDTSTINYLVVG